MRNGNTLSTAQECSTKHSRNVSEILVFFLPNRILVNEMFNCQKASCVSTITGRGPEPSVMNTSGHFFTPVLTLPEPFLSSVHEPDEYSVQCAYIFMSPAYIPQCRMAVASRVGSSRSLSWSRHAFYMLCDPVLMFHEQLPLFHVSTWAYSIHRECMYTSLPSRLEGLVSCCGLSVLCFSSCDWVGVCFATG